MIDLLVALAYCLCAACSDWLAVRWHNLRERAVNGGRPELASQVANTGVVMTLLAWVPVLWLFTTGSWSLVVADVVGSRAGSYWAVRKAAERSRQALRRL